MGDYCSDDYLLGNQVHHLGMKVALSRHVIDHLVINHGFVDSMEHQARWMKSTRFSRPKGHFGTGLTFSLPFGLLALGAAWGMGRPGLGLALLGWSVATRLAIAWGGGKAGGERPQPAGSAGALPGAGPDGIWVLDRELCLEPDCVARGDVRAAAGGQNAGGQVSQAAGGLPGADGFQMFTGGGRSTEFCRRWF